METNYFDKKYYKQRKATFERHLKGRRLRKRNVKQNNFKRIIGVGNNKENDI